MPDLHAFHTHRYPGARGRVVRGTAEELVQVGFCDGIVVAASLSGTWLSLSGCRTASGTGIAAKRWHLNRDRHPDKTSFHVAKRLHA